MGRQERNSHQRPRGSGSRHNRPPRGKGEGNSNSRSNRNYNQQSERPLRRDRELTPRNPDIESIIGALKLNDAVSKQEDEPTPIEQNSTKHKEVSSEKRTNTGKKNHRSKKATPRDVNLRAKLSDLLMKGLSECMVCLDKIRQHQATWDCHNCYQIFHIGCIKKWSKSATVESGWRCPGCQNVVETLPRDYRCFCRKLLNPEWNRNEGLVPHGCGEVCGRSIGSGPTSDCPHTCLDLCHPGPCHPCTAIISKTCHCGAETKRVKCEVELVCDNPCGKMLRCGQHQCSAQCHGGDCDPCQVSVNQVCFCGQSSQEVLCTSDIGLKPHFPCGKICSQTLDCGQHQCDELCHDGQCKSCSLAPAQVTHCPCGQTPLAPGTRSQCTDPVPLCDQVCGRPLTCGSPSAPHLCKAKCHTGKCTECPDMTSVKCRCGALDQDMPCVELETRADDARCQRKCTKKRTCGRHKCGELCCILVEHPCPIICNKLLSCKLHNCQDLCHTGKCKTCYNVSFDELTCHCGASVLYPPIPCGARPPDCSEPCRRVHACDHPVLHSCHSDVACPPCAALTTKLCYGGHEERRNIHCYVEGVSCGRTCNRQLKCGKHRCQRVCHPESCVDECSQPCATPRSSCGHPCGVPCHDGPCPESSCAAQIRIQCDCGRRQTSISCSDNSFSKLSTSLLASQMADMRAGNSVDLADLAKKNRKLECNEECSKMQRNAKLAEALSIDNPELSSKIIPRYSDFMKDYTKKDSNLCSMVHSKLAELVKLAKDSKQKSRSFSFPIMNREKRQFVHEYAEHFGCESQSYDAEPKRNVVVTATKEKSAIPSISLLEIVARQKKAPTPKMDLASESLPTYTNLCSARTGSDNKIDWFG